MDDQDNKAGGWWVKLYTNVQFSRMFQEVNRPGPMLAWIAFILFCKQFQKKAGECELQRPFLYAFFKLTDQDIDDMLRIGREHGALGGKGDFIVINNWDRYQGNKYKRRKDWGQGRHASGRGGIATGVVGVTDE